LVFYLFSFYSNEASGGREDEGTGSWDQRKHRLSSTQLLNPGLGIGWADIYEGLWGLWREEPEA
jgi:hypothetical protein